MQFIHNILLFAQTIKQHIEYIASFSDSPLHPLVMYIFALIPFVIYMFPRRQPK